MLSEGKHIEIIWASLNEAGSASNATLNAVENALQEYPQSPKLWCLRGTMIQLSEDTDTYTLEDALLSYQRAVEIDPYYAEAYEEMGHYYEVILDDQQRAAAYFNKLVELKRSMNPECNVMPAKAIT